MNPFPSVITYGYSWCCPSGNATKTVVGETPFAHVGEFCKYLRSQKKKSRSAFILTFPLESQLVEISILQSF